MSNHGLGTQEKDHIQTVDRPRLVRSFRDFDTKRAHPMSSLKRLIWIMPIFVLISCVNSNSVVAGDAKPDNSGPAKLLTASWLGGFGDDDLVAAAIAPDMTMVLAGNTVDLTLPAVSATILGPTGTLDATAADPMKKGTKWVHPSTHGFILRLSIDGQKVLSYSRFGHGQATIRKLRTDDKGNVFVLCTATMEIDLGVGKVPAGTFVAADRKSTRLNSSHRT